MARSTMLRVVLGVCAVTALASPAHAAEEDAQAEQRPHRVYTLADCLALADRNHPNIWAARARLGVARGQLDEAKLLPWFQWSATANAGLLPKIGGSVIYTQFNPIMLINPSTATAFEPYFSMRLDVVVPLYTFGKITGVLDLGNANVRLNEWDLEKNRQLVRMDVRRSYFGAMYARDMGYLSKEIIKKLDKALEGVNEHLAKGKKDVDETDRFRIEMYRDETLARAADATRGETSALAALRFFTGVQTGFDVPDLPLKKPDVPLAPVVQYIAAARVFRPEVNMARAGVEVRRAELVLQHARFFPDIGVGMFAYYSVAPGITTQNNGFGGGIFNYLGYGAVLGARWSLDFPTNAARVAQSESRLEEIRSTERYALGGVGVEVENAYAMTLEARQREEHWAHAEHQARQWVATVESQVDLGTKDERALVEPLRVYVAARLEHLRSIQDVNINMSDLARVSGWDSAAPTGS